MDYKVNELVNLLNELFEFDKSGISDLDINKKEDREELINELNKLKESPFFIMFSHFFGIDEEDINDIINKINKYQQEEKKKISSGVVRTEVKDKSEVIDRPSQHINTQIGLQIHKLVQEYVDTMIKPYNHNQISQQQMNDAYAGLYEFACWIYNHK